MGSKKRDLNHFNDVEDAQIDDNVVREPTNKKVKKEKKKVDAGVGSSDLSSSVKPMERRKKRKELDKEKHRTVVESKKPEGKVLDDARPSDIPTSDGKPGLNMRLFSELASADGSVRECAVEKLVTTLQEFQRGYDRLENRELGKSELKLEAEKDDGLEDCEPSVRYAVRRLVRGVSSSRECARQGFALALAVLLGAIRSIKIQSIMKLVIESLEISSSMKGQEVKDCLLGRLFAYGALVRSGRLYEEWISDKNTSCIKEFINQLILLAMKKRYLQEPAVSILLDLVEKFPADAVLGHIVEASGLQKWFDEAPEVGNPDALLLALKLREKISIESNSFGRLLPNPFSPRKFFTSDHLSIISNCLKECTFCQPRIHSVWPVLVKMLLPDSVLREEENLTSGSLKKLMKGRKSNSSIEETKNNLQAFCNVVEESLLLSSHDRKHLTFDVLLLLLPRLPASFIPIVMSYRLVQCLMDILSSKDSWLYKVAQYFLKDILEWVKHDDAKRVEVIVAFQKHSDGKFDTITRTKTVKELMAEFKSESGCMLFIQNLTNMFVDYSPDSEEPSDQSQTTDDNTDLFSNEDKDSTAPTGNSDILKSWVVESLPYIIKHIKLDPDAKFRMQRENLKFLSVQGLFSASLGSEVTSLELQEKFRWPKVATSSALRRMCIEQIQSLLAYAQKGDGAHALANCLESSDLGAFFIHFFCTLHSIPSVSLFQSLSKEDEKAIKKLQEMATRLLKEERNCGVGVEVNKLHALRYLLIQLLLQVLLRPGEFSEAVTELIICCRKAFPVTSVNNELTEDELDDEGGPDLMDVLVDTLLSLLPQSSAPTRFAIEQVFKFFCEDVTDDGLLRMLRVIKKDLKPARHQDTDMESDDDDGEDLLDIEDEEEVDEEETGETAEGDELADDSETETGAEVASTGTFEESDDSDGGMDDDEMFKMDAYLAQIFRERKNQTGGETAHSQLVLFKLRVLSLLEIYVHENPGKPQVFTVFSNLAQAFINLQTAEGSEQLGQRIWGILQKRILKAKDCPKGEAVELATLESLLERNLKLASKPFKRKKSAVSLSKKKLLTSRNRYKMITSLAQNSTFWILKIIYARDFSESELQRVLNIFQVVFIGYFESKKSQIKPEFLKEILKRRPWIGHNLFGFILEKCCSTKSEFRQIEALDLIVEILGSLLSSNSNKDSQASSKKILKSHLQKICQLVEKVVTNIPTKQSRRAAVRKFCGKVIQIVSSHTMKKPFLKNLSSEAHNACQTQLGELFTNLLNSKE